ncbi:hypothetical protein Tco_0146569 [Tanacetum coccineum]
MTQMSTKIKLTKDYEADSVDSFKYQENPKTTHLEVVKHIFRYIRGTGHLGLWYPKGIGIETIVHADSDHAGYYVDRKSTSGVCTFMRCCLTSWFAKKQTPLAISMTEAEYVSAGKACQQALWMKQALIDYGIRLDDVPIMCNNRGDTNLNYGSTIRFTLHEHVMDPLDISRNPIKEKGKKTAFPLIISSSSSSSDDNEAPSFLEFYDELSDSEDLTKGQ